MTVTDREVRHFHLFCGLAGGAKGFNAAEARVGNLRARFRCLGGIDNDPAIVRDFTRLAGVHGTCLDLFDREQYRDWHGKEPPAGWREATPDDIRRAAGNERPHIVFTSPPCKGLSGLLNETRARSSKYQALNRLTLRGVWLMLEAWADDPPEFVLLENVPRIATRGRHLLDQIESLLTRYGYAVRETTHDCGELGNLAQSRKRFLLVARHQEKVPPFLYEPEKRPLRAVGTVLDRMPLPGDLRGGVMHRVPALQWRTWLRLAFVEAGSDWRSLNKLAVEDGFLRDYAIVLDHHQRNGYLGVHGWAEPMGTVAGESRPTNGGFAVADPCFGQSEQWNDGHAYGVKPWTEPSSTVTAKLAPGSGYGAVADPRCRGTLHNTAYRIVRWDEAGRCVTAATGNGSSAVADPRVDGGHGYSNYFRVVGWEDAGRCVTSGLGPTNGAQSVADPRCATSHEGHGKYRVTPYDGPAGSVIGASTTGQGAFAVADPRPGKALTGDQRYLTAGNYGVIPFDAPAYAVTGSACHDNGFNSVADPRMPEPRENTVAVIRALDGTWHRPFTTLELAALQSLIDPEEVLELDGMSDSAWRERIGNAVPPHAAKAIASVMGETLLMAWSGITFVLSAQPIWVRPIAVAIALPGRASL